MKKVLSIITLAIAMFFASVSYAEKTTEVSAEMFENYAANLYDEIGLINQSYPPYDVFAMALKGYQNLKASEKVNKDILTVIDFSKSSNEKRLWVIDLNTKKVLFNDYVAHGRNSGNEFANNFSNLPQSFMSSIGFYLTAETYHGKHGLSLRLDGIDGDFNYNARSRAIVMHGADYVSEDFIKKYGRLGRSYGCPSVSMDIFNDVIDTIREGSLLFIYYPHKDYPERSAVLNPEMPKI
ncbi:MAG: murein L,D-transpeptidase catalytic domain family protein [Bacteroidales bacterium]